MEAKERNHGRLTTDAQRESVWNPKTRFLSSNNQRKLRIQENIPLIITRKSVWIHGRKPN